MERKTKVNMLWAVGIAGASLTLLVLFCIGATVIRTLDGLNESKHPKPAAASAQETPSGDIKAPAISVPQVSARELSRAYNANEVAANDQYKNKRIKVVGGIADIKENLWGSPVVSLEGCEIFQSVDCTFSNAARSELAALRKGRRAYIKGTVTGMIMGSVQMDNCSISEE